MDEDQLLQSPYELMQEERQKALQGEKTRLMEAIELLREEVKQGEVLLQKAQQDAVAQINKIELETEALRLWMDQVVYDHRHSVEKSPHKKSEVNKPIEAALHVVS